MDLHALLEESVLIPSGEKALIHTGIALEIPEGFEAQVRPRSGLAFKHGLTVLNAPGTIDSDYRGEVAVILVNLGKYAVSINDGDRIAQLVFAPITQVRLEETDVLSETKRGTGGLGSTG
jgi:dUTP pyrophosphatase